MPKCMASTTEQGTSIVLVAVTVATRTCGLMPVMYMVRIVTYTLTKWFLSFSIEAVESVQKSGKICILDIDVQGVQKVKASQLQPPPRYIFIAPPSRDDLEKRLRSRNTETEEAIQTRLANAQAELDYGNTSGNFDRVFVNADLQACFKDLVSQFQEWYPHLVATVSEEEDKAKNDKNCTCDISWGGGGAPSRIVFLHTNTAALTNET